MFIQGLRIELGDSQLRESTHKIVGPELVFSKNHNLLMYLKAILTVQDDEGDNDDSNEKYKSKSLVSVSEGVLDF